MDFFGESEYSDFGTMKKSKKQRINKEDDNKSFVTNNTNEINESYANNLINDVNNYKKKEKNN